MGWRPGNWIESATGSPSRTAGSAVVMFVGDAGHASRLSVEIGKPIGNQLFQDQLETIARITRRGPPGESFCEAWSRKSGSALSVRAHVTHQFAASCRVTSTKYRILSAFTHNPKVIGSNPTRDTHWNIRGNRVAAEAEAAFLRAVVCPTGSAQDTPGRGWANDAGALHAEGRDLGTKLRAGG
jgi:hypothetical protein